MHVYIKAAKDALDTTWNFVRLKKPKSNKLDLTIWQIQQKKVDYEATGLSYKNCYTNGAGQATVYVTDAWVKLDPTIAQEQKKVNETA